MAKAKPTYDLPAWAEGILSALETRGEAWVVGGYVRDLYMGNTPGDLDIACNLPAEETMSLLTSLGYTVVPTGLKHGTVTAIAEGNPVEITAYRADGEYLDGRHPESVTVARTITEDLARRDFTMNAMAWHPDRGIIDPFGGREDMAAHVIRCVGTPAERFREDALRILRAIRFSSQLGFSLEAETEAAARAAKESITLLSAERIYTEMTKLLLGEHAAQVLLSQTEIIGAVLPEALPCFDCPQITKYHCYNVWGHIAHAVGAARNTELVRWATLLHDIGKPAAASMDDGVSHFKDHASEGLPLVNAITARLKFPGAIRDALPLLVKYHDTPIANTPKAIRRMYGKLHNSTELFEALLDVKIADSLAHAPDYRERAVHAEELRATFHEMLETKAPLRVADLDITGSEIMALGIPQGPAVGHILHALFAEVVDEVLDPDHDSLLARAKELAAQTDGRIQ